MSVTPRFSFRARGASFRHAIRGLSFMMRTQHNAWLHALATGVVGLCGLGLKISGFEWCVVILSMMAVWTAEAFNTAVECVTDLASPDFHVLAGKAKDVAAAAVLITAFGAATTGIIIFAPRVGAILAAW